MIESRFGHLWTAIFILILNLLACDLQNLIEDYGGKVGTTNL